MGAPLFAALARAAKQCMGELVAQNLANTAWAFGKVDQANGLLFAALARAAKKRMGEVNA